MENKAISVKQANETDTGKEGHSEPAISSINDDFSLDNFSEDELRVVHKHIFLRMFNSLLHLADDLLSDKRKSYKRNFRRKN